MVTWQMGVRGQRWQWQWPEIAGTVPIFIMIWWIVVCGCGEGNGKGSWRAFKTKPIWLSIRFHVTFINQWGWNKKAKQSKAKSSKKKKLAWFLWLVREESFSSSINMLIHHYYQFTLPYTIWPLFHSPFPPQLVELTLLAGSSTNDNSAPKRKKKKNTPYYHYPTPLSSHGKLCTLLVLQTDKGEKLPWKENMRFRCMQVFKD